MYVYVYLSASPVIAALFKAHATLSSALPTDSPGADLLSLLYCTVFGCDGHTDAVMLFPILLAVLLIPFACFCLPCVLRLLIR